MPQPMVCFAASGLVSSLCRIWFINSNGSNVYVIGLSLSLGFIFSNTGTPSTISDGNRLIFTKTPSSQAALMAAFFIPQYLLSTTPDCSYV